MKQAYTISLSILAILAGAVLLLVAATTRSSSLDQNVDAYLKENHFQGAALIGQGGKILFSRGYGFSHAESQIANTPQTLFRIGSITKQFTAAAIMQLQEQGKLLVSDPINKYLPDYPEGEAITIHHLLSHTSGIPSITEFKNLQEIQVLPTTALQTLSYFNNLPLQFPPGTDCYYSDSGYIVLGAIIEKLAKVPYGEYLQKTFFEPLWMHSTFLEPAHYSEMASGYEKEMLQAKYIDMTFPHSAGALVSSVEDLYIWDQALKENRILSKTSVESLFTIHGSSRKNRITYGYGFFIGPKNEELEKAQSSIVGHFGTIEGFRAASFRYLDDDLTIILLSNVETTDINALHLELARRYWRS